MSPSSARMRVLIADDDRDTLMTLGILVRSEGFDVELAQRGADVLDAVRRFGPHCILLDISMPDRTGHEIALDLINRYRTACPVLVAVTARTGDSEKQLAKANGFRYYIPKPYDPDQVLALLAELRKKL